MADSSSRRTDADNELGHLLWEVGARATMLQEVALVDVSLTPAMLGVLDSVVAHPGITVGDMAEHLPKSQQAISQTVSRLAARALIERHPGSGRSVQLHVTAAGLVAHQRGSQIERTVAKRLHDALGAADHERLRKLLMQARSALETLR